MFVLGAGGPGAWREVAPRQRACGARALVASGAIGLYVIGGRDGSTEVAVPEAYDPRADARQDDLPAMPAPRNHLAG